MKSKENNNQSQKQKAAHRKAKEELREIHRNREELKHQRLVEAVQRSKKKMPLNPMFDGIIERSSKAEEYIRDNEHFERCFSAILHKREKFFRPIKDWKPQGKSGHALFISLANHVFAKYKTPQFLWNEFIMANLPYQDAVIHIATGGSLYSLVKDKTFPVQLTRQMCHLFLQAPSTCTLPMAVRYAQVLGFGGNKRLWEAIAHAIPNIVPARYGYDANINEDLFATEIQWFCNQSMLDPNQVKPIHDYIAHCCRQAAAENKTYSLKGRNADSIIRQMQDWHANLNKMKVGRFNAFKPSGFEEGTYDFSREGTTEVWRVREILTAKELQEEGRRQSHCVFSYAHAIEKGRCSIWVLTQETFENNWAECTIEIDNANRKLVQVRGRYNRPPTVKQNQVLTRWATEKGLRY